MDVKKNLIRNIPFAGGVLKNLYDKRSERSLILKIKKFLKNELPFVKDVPPKYFLGHEPTIRCNLKCKMCYQGQTRSLRLDELSAEEILKIYEKLEERISEIKLVGGEPFVRRDILEMIRFWDARGVKIALQTNCVLFNKDIIKELKKYKNIIAFLVSLDGTENEHDKIRGAPGAYKKMINATRLIRENMPFAKISIFGIILQDSLKNMRDLIDVCKKENFGSLNLIFEQVYNEGDIEKTKKIFNDIFNWSGADYRLNTQIRNPVFENTFNSEFLKKELKKLRNYGFKKKVFVNFVPFNFYYNLSHYLGEENKKRVFCSKLLNPELRVNQEGNVVWCDVIEKPFGNLLRQPPDEIWLSDEYQKFRNFLFENSFSVCRRCCKAIYL